METRRPRVRWNPAKEQLLLQLIELFGEDWDEIGRGMMMPPYSCHDHYTRYMKFSKAPWTSAEEGRLRELVGELGTRWVWIAESLGTKRSGGDVRNRWKKIKNMKITPIAEFLPPQEAVADDDFFHFDEDP
jgi:hypothetical protein